MDCDVVCMLVLVTSFVSNFTARDIRDVDLASSGGITHEWFNGSVIYPYVCLRVV